MPRCTAWYLGWRVIAGMCCQKVSLLLEVCRLSSSHSDSISLQRSLLCISSDLCFLLHPSMFAPFHSVSVQVKVSRHDEEPVGHGGLRVQMVCDIDVPTTKKPQRLLHQNLTVDAAGRAEFRIEKTPCSTTGVNCRVSYSLERLWTDVCLLL